MQIVLKLSDDHLSKQSNLQRCNLGASVLPEMMQGSPVALLHFLKAHHWKSIANGEDGRKIESATGEPCIISGSTLAPKLHRWRLLCLDR